MASIIRSIAKPTGIIDPIRHIIAAVTLAVLPAARVTVAAMMPVRTVAREVVAADAAGIRRSEDPFFSVPGALSGGEARCGSRMFDHQARSNRLKVVLNWPRP